MVGLGLIVLEINFALKFVTLALVLALLPDLALALSSCHSPRLRHYQHNYLQFYISRICAPSFCDITDHHQRLYCSVDLAASVGLFWLQFPEFRCKTS